MINIKSIRLIQAIALFSVCHIAYSSVVYEYTGNNYQSVFDLEPLDSTRYTTAMRLTGSFILADPLGAFHSIETAINPDAFSFTDGLHTLTQDNADISSFFFETDAFGTITDWKVNLGTGYPDPVSAGDTKVTLTTWSIIDSGYITRCLTPSGFDSSWCTGILLDEGMIEYNPGTWAVPSVPVPSAVWLFGTGLIGLIGVARRK